jgi:NCS2 family nucleobase:cation symporter-2
VCKPQLPCITAKPPKFFKNSEGMPILIATVMGLQHALAMLGGIITVPLVATYSTPFKPTGAPGAEDTLNTPETAQYLVAASLITCGLLSLIQIIQIPLPGGYYIGTGMISVVGTSFVFLPIAEQALKDMVADGFTGREAYGKLLGTCMVATWLEVGLSFLKPSMIRKLFPPLVSGVCVICIGLPLTGTGLKYWGGGVWCQEHFDERAYDSGRMFGGAPPSCSGNGEVKLPYGSPEYFGLGASCFFMMIFVECFGNPFMKNCNVVISLIFGYIVASFAQLSPDHPKAVDFGADCTVFGNPFNPCDIDGSGTLDYVTSAKMDIAPAFTFLWVETFPIGFYGPAFVPILIGMLASTIETVGDIHASADASKLREDNMTDEEYEKTVDERVQGGLLADGLNTFAAAWMTQLPNTTYSQNNGVISLTNCGSRAAGIACCLWLIFFGVFAKVAALITSIPDCVLGGVTTFLFANVVVSGIRIIASDADFMSGDRRARAILSISLGIGCGVAMKPGWIEPYLANSHMYGIWPKSSDCAQFCTPAIEAVEAAAATCVGPEGVDCGIFTDAATCEDTCGCVFTAAVEAAEAIASVCAADNPVIFNVQGPAQGAPTLNCGEWSGMRSVRDAIILILKTPNCIGPLLALVLNLVLPSTSTEAEQAIKQDERKETSA